MTDHKKQFIKLEYLLMAEKTPKNPKGSGQKRRYNEDTINATFRVPISKKDEFRKFANEILKKWQIKPAK